MRKPWGLPRVILGVALRRGIKSRLEFLYQMDLATVDKLLTTTRSVRKRLDLTRPGESEIIPAERVV